MKSGLVAACTAALVATPGAAQDAAALIASYKATNDAIPAPADGEVLATLLPWIQSAALRSGTCVPGSLTIEPLRPAIGDASIVKAHNERIVANAWTTYATVQGCPNEPKWHTLVGRLFDGRLVYKLMGKGETVANYAMITDAAPGIRGAAAAALSKRVPGCAEFVSQHTRIVQRGVDLAADQYGTRFAGHWIDSWTVTGCGQTVEIPVAFTADGVGGAYFAVFAPK